MIKIIEQNDFGQSFCIPLFKYLHTDMIKQKEKFNLLAETLKSIAHPERLAILFLLCHCTKGGLTVKHIYKTMNIEQPIASRHLGILKRGGLLKRDVKKTGTYYYMNMEHQLSKCISNCL